MLNRWPQRARVLALSIALGALAGAALADVPVFTKTCVDLNGGDLCEDDWVQCSLHVEVEGAQERLTLSDVIYGNFYREFRIPDPPPAPSTDCSQNVGAPLMPGINGIYCFTNIVMQPGSAFDFIYEARVGSLSFGSTTCGWAFLRNDNLQGWNSNRECVEYTCIEPGPNVLTTKIWTGPDPVVVGTPVTFTIEVTNAGDQPDTDVNVFDVVAPIWFNDSGPFVTTNVVGTQTLLDACRDAGCVQRFIQIGTDEVYGSLPLGPAPPAVHRGIAASAQQPLRRLQGRR